MAPSQAIEFRAAIVLLAGALATLVACVGCVPAEALRIRVVADPQRFEGDNLFGMAARVSREEGNVLYNGFRPLVVRQVIFGMVKFFFFDSWRTRSFNRFRHSRRRLGVVYLCPSSRAWRRAPRHH